MNQSDKQAYDFIHAMSKTFGDIEFIAKGSLGIVVKTKGYKYIKPKYEIIPYVKKKIKNEI